MITRLACSALLAAAIPAALPAQDSSAAAARPAPFAFADFTWLNGSTRQKTSVLDSRFLRVPREGPHSRFLPAKDWDELAVQRDQIAARVEPFLTDS